MAQINNLAPTTETEALNIILSAIGEAPVESIDTAPGTDVEIVIATLREATKGVQATGWRFNTDLGLELGPSDTVEWLHSDGVTTTTLNVWKPPSDMVSWKLARHPSQRGLQLTIRPSKQYNGGGEQIFYDQAQNRDGLDAAVYDALYVNAVYLFDFEDLPESARDYITKLSAMRAASRISADEREVSFSVNGVRDSYRRLRREQAWRDRYNIFDSDGPYGVGGGRQRPSTGRVQDYTNNSSQ